MWFVVNCVYTFMVYLHIYYFSRSFFSLVLDIELNLVRLIYFIYIERERERKKESKRNSSRTHACLSVVSLVIFMTVVTMMMMMMRVPMTGSLTGCVRSGVFDVVAVST